MTQLKITGQLILDLFKIVVHCLDRQATSEYINVQVLTNFVKEKFVCKVNVFNESWCSFIINKNKDFVQVPRINNILFTFSQNAKVLPSDDLHFTFIAKLTVLKISNFVKI